MHRLHAGTMTLILYMRSEHPWILVAAGGAEIYPPKTHRDNCILFPQSTRSGFLENSGEGDGATSRFMSAVVLRGR
jgi:hypothetical protein